MQRPLLGLVLTLSAIALMPTAAGATSSLYAYADGSGTAASCAATATPSEGCSLTEALSEATAGDTVYLATPGAGEGAGVYVGNWTVNTPDTSSSAPLVITAAPDLAAAPILDGNGGAAVDTATGRRCQTSTCDHAILTIEGPVDLFVTDVAFIDGDDDANNAADSGGAIINGAGADLGISDDTFLDNSAAESAGAIANNVDDGATLRVLGSTFSGNSSQSGGAIVSDGFPVNNSVLSVSDSTFTDNRASGAGGAIDVGNLGGVMTLTDSTFADNTASAGNGPIIESGTAQAYVAANIFDGSCYYAGSWDDLGDNVGTDASCENGGSDDVSDWAGTDLGPLTANGGPTETMWPEAGNPAIGRVSTYVKVMAGNATIQLCPRIDQRGGRSTGLACAAGAVEPSVVVTGPEPDVATQGVPYHGAVTAGSGFGGSNTYAVTSGTKLPPGLNLNPNTGALTGTPTQAGSYLLTIATTNSNGDNASDTTTFTVVPASDATGQSPPVSTFTTTTPKVASGGDLSVTLSTHAAGLLTARATFPVTVKRVVTRHGRRITRTSTVTETYASTARRISTAGPRVLTLRVTRTAARELAKLHTARVTVLTTFTPSGGPEVRRSVTLTVERAPNGRYR